MSAVLIILGLLVLAVAFAVVFYLSNTRNQEISKKTIEELRKHLESSNSLIAEATKKLSDAEIANKNAGYTNPIVSYMPVGAVFIDESGSILLSNKYAEGYLAIVPSIGKSYKDAINFSLSGKRDYSLFEAAFMGKDQELPMGSELVTQRGNIAVAGNITVLSLENGKALLFTFTDNSRNVARIQEEKEFFSTAAHELRTPLTGIGLTMAILLKQFDTLSKEKIVDYLTKTGEATEYLTKLVNDFLNLSRLDQGRLVVEKKSFNIVALTDEVIKEISPLVKQRKLFIQHETIEDVYHNVIGDPIKTKEILTNLISNSIKYTVQGGITITHSSTDTAFVTRISDTGNGIPEDDRALLFKRFGQVGVARQQLSTKSSGLGLYISKKIAQLMRGDVILEASEPGKGTTFAFSLPMDLSSI